MSGKVREEKNAVKSLKLRKTGKWISCTSDTSKHGEMLRLEDTAREEKSFLKIPGRGAEVQGIP